MDKVTIGSAEELTNRTERTVDEPTINDSRTNATIDKSAEKGEQEPINPSAGIDRTARKKSPSAGTKRATTKAPGVDLTKDGKRALASQLVGVHHIAGLVIGQPELMAITPQQSDALITAICDVMDQYKIKPNPRAVAWANLIGLTAVIYGPKYLMYREIMKDKRRKETPSRAPSAPTPGFDYAQPKHGQNVTHMKFE